MEFTDNSPISKRQKGAFLSENKLKSNAGCFLDCVKIFVRAGNGGHGAISFRREKFVPKGGPDGGTGGNGGDVVLSANSNINTLLSYKYRRHIRAENGAGGGKSNKSGKCGKSVSLMVPIGTQVFTEDGILLHDLESESGSFIAAKGGKGGKGNASYATATHQAPRRAEEGEKGDAKWIRLELKLMADVGLVGLPNAGKSTLLSIISNAKPKIADYPFTTLEPMLGVIQCYGFKTFVVADIPGLIEGAHKGAGMGSLFLKHIERTKILWHLVDLSSELSPIKQFEVIQDELKVYPVNLAEKPKIIIGTKIDIVSNAKIEEKFISYINNKGFPCLVISAVNKNGLNKLISLTAEMLGISKKK